MMKQNVLRLSGVDFFLDADDTTKMRLHF